MSRTMVIALGLALVAVGCKDDDETCTQTPAIETLFPGDGEVPGLAYKSGTAFETTDDALVLDGLIDGAADPFMDYDFVVWGRRFYADATSDLEYHVYQMPSVAKNQETWDAELVSANNYRQSQVSGGWTDVPGIGDETRVASAGTAIWWYGSRKCAYQADLHITDVSTGVKSDATKTVAETFLKAAIEKIPK